MGKGQFGEPWESKKFGSGYGNKNAMPIYGGGNQVASAEYLGGTAKAEENAARIVACVNACDGIPDPAEAVERARAGLKRALELLEPFDDPGLSLGLGSDALTPIRAALAALEKE